MEELGILVWNFLKANRWLWAIQTSCSKVIRKNMDRCSSKYKWCWAQDHDEEQGDRGWGLHNFKTSQIESMELSLLKLTTLKERILNSNICFHQNTRIPAIHSLWSLQCLCLCVGSRNEGSSCVGCVVLCWLCCVVLFALLRGWQRWGISFWLPRLST